MKPCTTTADENQVAAAATTAENKVIRQAHYSGIEKEKQGEKEKASRNSSSNNNSAKTETEANNQHNKTTEAVNTQNTTEKEKGDEEEELVSDIDEQRQEALTHDANATHYRRIIILLPFGFQKKKHFFCDIWLEISFLIGLFFTATIKRKAATIYRGHLKTIIPTKKQKKSISTAQLARRSVCTYSDFEIQ